MATNIIFSGVARPKFGNNGLAFKVLQSIYREGDAIVCPLRWCVNYSTVQGGVEGFLHRLS